MVCGKKPLTAPSNRRNWIYRSYLENNTSYKKNVSYKTVEYDQFSLKRHLLNINVKKCKRENVSGMQALLYK